MACWAGNPSRDPRAFATYVHSMQSTPIVLDCSSVMDRTRGGGLKWRDSLEEPQNWGSGADFDGQPRSAPPGPFVHPTSTFDALSRPLCMAFTGTLPLHSFPPSHLYTTLKSLPLQFSVFSAPSYTSLARSASSSRAPASCAAVIASPRSFFMSPIPKPPL
jgi:hypothetical protein